MPKISIIMPVYNNEKYFPIAVESILRQDYEDYEFIIIDDGSTDHTAEIADAFACLDARIRVVHQKNQWIYASFNHGIELAKGEYLYIVNSDDRLKPGSLKLMAGKIEEYHPDVIWTKVLSHKCNENQVITEYDYLHEDEKIKQEMFFKNTDEVRDHWLLFYKTNLAQNQANLYKCNIMKRHRFRNDRYGADALFNISIASDVNSALILKEAVYDHFLYSTGRINASLGTYYGYEHEMFHEFYLEYSNLFQQWGRLNTEVTQYLGRRRIKSITNEIRCLQSFNCNLTLEEKVRKIFDETIDELVFQCAVDAKAVEELEARVLSGLRELLAEEELNSESDIYFAYELLESLIRYEKDEEDYRRIRHAVWHPRNKYHIGQTFLEKLTGEKIDV